MRITNRVQSQHADSSLVRCTIPFKRFHGCCLTGAVWSKQRENLASLDSEAKRINDLILAVTFAEIVNDDGFIVSYALSNLMCHLRRCLRFGRHKRVAPL